ncbi:voltage-gated potassium channel protein [Scandinavium sp. V105_16]|uniref:Voltage-gated potassium channel protein n=1 Tax=Scandinavium lactucae TaxID=3095028 RepID=A0AAJ2VYZ6_9ENTR|nr:MULTISPECIES: voltage-gated potassium channel protein [unclassified Scandinavium]MDX6022715.1 voltage-gated potassium channel protein [Scandinavium sp. V105_16]MDX6033443.1 voltage-gated potassium channel protein [Scandinavium sp. V105_12]MDX6042761.1 voltage-gated potassium channel protein [Scandinavium sp. V105_6]MDX6052762.1 voltage-gated potassium channel protein [Scandinavium sp. V105_1]
MKTLFKKLSAIKTVLPPHRCIGLLTLIIGCVFLKPLLLHIYHFIPQARGTFTGWKDLISTLGLLTLPQVGLGIAMVLMSIGLFLRARVAWSFTLILLVAVALFNYLLPGGSQHIGNFALFDGLCLLWFWREFSQSSLAAGTLFALISFASLLTYALCGSLYLGEEFHPVIDELSTALYFSTVSMSTVGFGDIVPVTPSARLFTVSIIILGITVFATSISAIIGPVIGGNLKRMIKGRISHAMRKNHMIIIGATPLALSVYNGLKERGDTVTVIVPPGVGHDYPADTDLITDDPSSDKTLRDAGADKARYILVLRNDDSDNAFIVLAAKEVVGSESKILALVNSDKNLKKIKRVQPDIVFSLQTLASEMLLRKLSGENMDTDNLMELLFQDGH